MHILVCDKHKHNPENVALLETYKAKCVQNRNQKEFSLNISIFHTPKPGTFNLGVQNHEDASIYMLQSIAISQQNFNIFFDNGCSDMLISKKALDKFIQLGRAENISKEPSSMTGIGDLKTVSNYGRWRISIPLINGNQAYLTGQCLEKITGRFDDVLLEKAGEDFRVVYEAAGYDLNNFPKLPVSVGGDTDILLGIQYMKYWPRQVYQLPNGCTLYESQFIGNDGSRGVIGGPHASFNCDHDNAHHAYFSDVVKDYGTTELGTCEFTGSLSRLNSAVCPGEGSISFLSGVSFNDLFQRNTFTNFFLIFYIQTYLYLFLNLLSNGCKNLNKMFQIFGILWQTFLRAFCTKI